MPNSGLGRGHQIVTDVCTVKAQPDHRFDPNLYLDRKIRRSRLDKTS